MSCLQAFLYQTINSDIKSRESFTTAGRGGNECMPACHNCRPCLFLRHRGRAKCRFKPAAGSRVEGFQCLVMYVFTARHLLEICPKRQSNVKILRNPEASGVTLINWGILAPTPRTNQ